MGFSEYFYSCATFKPCQEETFSGLLPCLQIFLLILSTWWGDMGQSQEQVHMLLEPKFFRNRKLS